MFLDNELNAFIERLKTNEKLSETNIIKAYPYVYKPTRLKDVVIAVSPAQIKANNCCLGQSELYADYTINADIYIPVDIGTPEMWKYIEGVISSQVDSFPSAISVSPIESDDKLFCYTAKCSVSYNGLLQFSQNQIADTE